MEVERLGTEAEKEARAWQMGLEPTRAEQESSSAEETGQKTSTVEQKTPGPEQEEL